MCPKHPNFRRGFCAGCIYPTTHTHTHTHNKIIQVGTLPEKVDIIISKHTHTRARAT